MDKILRILHLEDDPDYSDLVKAMLEKDGLRVELVLAGDYADFIAALGTAPFDIILADYSLPSCTGLEALQAARQMCPDTPVLLISGAIGEHAAIESLRCGAADCVLKQWPERLVPAVRRALREAEERAQRKALEAQLRHAQKMEEIGQLAGGVAHDFNNLLVVIRGNAEIVLMDPAKLSQETRECLRQIIAAAERAANLTRQLLAFSRKQSMQFRPLGLNQVVENLSKMLNRIIGEDIESAVCQRGRRHDGTGAGQPGRQCPRRHASGRQTGHYHAADQLPTSRCPLTPGGARGAVRLPERIGHRHRHRPGTFAAHL